MRSLTTIAFDADDTLWHNERFFRDSEEQFAALLTDFADTETVTDTLLETERRTVHLYGFGVMGFALAMLETATSLAGDNLPASTVNQILALGKAMLDHPMEVFDGVEDTLKALGEDYALLVVTKGDLFHQERKLVQSGLQDLFDHVEIVSDKNADTYMRIFDRHGQGASRAMMIGNSLKSDIVPSLEAGSWGVYIPHAMTWSLEHADEPADHPRYRRVDTIAAIPEIVADVQAQAA